MRFAIQPVDAGHVGAAAEAAIPEAYMNAGDRLRVQRSGAKLAESAEAHSAAVREFEEHSHMRMQEKREDKRGGHVEGEHADVAMHVEALEGAADAIQAEADGKGNQREALFDCRRQLDLALGATMPAARADVPRIPHEEVVLLWRTRARARAA